MTQRTDTSGMIPAHRVLRDTLSAAPTLVGGAGDAERRALIANYYENVLWFLAAHHEGEEEVVFPLLRERCPDQASTVERMASQHHGAMELLADAQTTVAAWGSGDAESDEVAARLDALLVGLVPHLDDEESVILPLGAEYLSQAEWDELPGHGMRSFKGDKIWLILGLIRQRMTEDQRAAMLAEMPPPAVEMWTSFGESAFLELDGVVGSTLPA